MPELARLFDAHQARDPTQTIKLRKAFRATAKMRLRQWRAQMRNAVLEHNILGFSSRGPSFHPPQVRLQAFSGWLNGVGGQILLGTDWARPYIERAWRVGEAKAIRETGRGAGPDRSEMIAALARVEIEGILGVTTQQVAREAAKVIARGTPKQRAMRQLFSVFDKLAQPRLVVMCDVLAIKAYNEAKLSSYAASGIRRVGIQAESLPGGQHTHMDAVDAAERPGISEIESAGHLVVGVAEELEKLEAEAEEEQLVGILTAGDDKVCQECEDWAENSPYEIEEVRDVYPLHPRCRCAVYPWEDLRFKGDAFDAYDPSEPRDPDGKWTGGGAGDYTWGRGEGELLTKNPSNRDIIGKLTRAQAATPWPYKAELRWIHWKGDIWIANGVDATHEQMIGEIAKQGVDIDTSWRLGGFIKKEDLGDIRKFGGVKGWVKHQYPEYTDAYDPSEPRDPEGKWTTGGGGSGGAGKHPGKGYSAAARIDKHGVIQTTSVYDAQLALAQGHDVELDQPRKVSVLIDRLGAAAAKMIEHGDKAPNYNLCGIMIKGESLFCHENQGIPRIKMPQLDKQQTKAFIAHLKEQGYEVTKEKVRSDHLRATQEEISGAKVAEVANKLRTRFGGEVSKRLIVSKDDYVLDGHHHWAAKMGIDYADGTAKGDTKLKVSRVDISITKLLKLANQFTGGKGAKGTGDAIEDKYNPDQPRDPAGVSTGGQWTSQGGGGGTEFVSPNVETNSDPQSAIAMAHKNIRSSRQHALRRASTEIDEALKLSSVKHDAIGAWHHGAEHTVVTSHDGNPDWETLRVSAAMKGHLADQKQVLVFKQEEGGISALYRMHVGENDLVKLHQELIQDGLAFHTIVPHIDGGGADVFVVDHENQAHDAMARAAERYNADVTYEVGKSEFIGSTKEDGTDREQRDDARRIYQEVIKQSKVQGSQKVWKSVHHAWGEELGVAPPVVANQWGEEQGLVPSRKVKSKKIRSEGYARPDIASMRTDPKAFEHNVSLFSHEAAYPNFRPGELKGTPDERVRTIVEHMKSNLRFLYANASDTIKQSGTGWYDKAHALAVSAGARYGISDRAAAGVIATLSPQKDWNQNIYLAHAVMEINHSQKDHKWDADMATTSDRIWKEKDREVVERVQGKTLGELTDPTEKAVWIRTYDEAHSDRTYHDFDSGELVTKKGRKAGTREPSRAAWQSIPAIANAVECLDSGGDLNVISEALGEKHKVRSFYNNIAAPQAPNGDVTIDTHAVGVALLRPLSGKTIAVMHGLGTSPQRPQGKRGKDWKPPEGWKATSKSVITGLSGTYAIYADAYREVATELGVLPQQLQAVTWQEKRILFAGGPKKRAAVEHEWTEYHSGAQTLEQTQENVLNISRSVPGEAAEEDDDEDDK